MLMIVYNLFSALKALVASNGQMSSKTVYFLSWRVGLSLSLFLILMIGIGLGLIPVNPHPALQ